MPISLPRITIVTPSFNQGDFIEETICSILDQGYPNLQYIIMDGGSQDRTVEIIKKYEQHISYWASGPDKGQSHAINKGLARADGDIFNWINSDDGLLPDALQHIGERYLQKPFDALLTRTSLVRNQTQIGINGATKKGETHIESALEIGLNQPGHFYNAQRFKSLNGVDERYAYVMDLDLWIRFLLTFGQEGVELSDAITTFFRFHGESKSELEGWGEGSAFEAERIRMYHRLARSHSNRNAAIAFRHLYPQHKPEYEPAALQSNIPEHQLSEWINAMLFTPARRAFYAEEFGRTAALSKGFIPSAMPPQMRKDALSMRRHAAWKAFLQKIWP
jgi:glycosyltransferase involved in cell wall biosynthesis